ncbi:Zona pellucida-like domain family protein [Brugia pahangi]
MTVTLEQFVAGKEDNNISIQRIAEIPSKNITITSYSVNKSLPHLNDTRRASNDAVIFDIFHNGQPIEAVVVGSKITLSFIPYYAIPSIYMSIKGCQVEPIGSIYEWEREPLAIIKDGCQADHVGLVCPPQKTEYGIRVIAESFRYQTTSKVQYSCLVRICPFSPCPLETCEEVEGCGNSNLLSNTFGLRIKRHITIDDIRAALVANPDLQRQIRLMNRFGTQSQTTSEMQQQLIELSGDHIVKKQLVVVNSEDELRYYVRTGDVP